MLLRQLYRWRNPSTWSTLSRTESGHPNLRQNILFSQLCVLACVFTIIQSADDFVEVNYIMMTIDVFVLGLMVMSHRLNENGRHLLSKSILIAFLNILFFFLSSVIAPISKMDLLYYPLLILTFMTLGREGIKIGFGFAVLTFALLITLELTNHQPFGNMELQQGNMVQGLINIFTACFFIGLSAIFFVNLSDKTEKSLRRKKDELIKANSELDKFVYCASHDMRAPLSSILGLVNIALLEPDAEKIPSYLKMIKERTHRLDEFVQDVTNYSRNTKLELDLKEEDVTLIIQEALEKIKYIDGFDAIYVDMCTSPLWIKTDKSRMSVILNNLLTNSIKYHDLKKVDPFINITVEDFYEGFKIKIIDNGSGINPEHLGKIFNMFYRATEKSKGSGLGLYIVKELVEKMQGSITVKSEFGVGTEFELTFPNFVNHQPILKVA